MMQFVAGMVIGGFLGIILGGMAMTIKYERGKKE